MSENYVLITSGGAAAMNRANRAAVGAFAAAARSLSRTYKAESLFFLSLEECTAGKGDQTESREGGGRVHLFLRWLGFDGSNE